MMRAIFGAEPLDGAGLAAAFFAGARAEETPAWLAAAALLEAPAAFFCLGEALFGGEAGDARAALRLVTAAS